MTDDKKEILQDSDRDDLPPFPPCWMTRLPPNAPLAPGASERPIQQPRLPYLPPPPPEVVETPPRQAPIPEVGASGQSPQDSAPAQPPKLYPPLPVSTDRKGKGDTGIRQRLRSTKELGKGPHYPCPSESYNSPQFRPHVAYDYQPFSSMDILNWQKHTPPYSEEPQGMIRLLETIFRTYCPR